MSLDLKLVPHFTSDHTRFAYELRYHLGFQAYCRQPLFANAALRDAVDDLLPEVCQIANFHLLEHSLDDKWLRLLLSLRPQHSPATSAGIIKGNLSRLLRARDASSSAQSFWARGYYLRSVGHVTAATIQSYVANQADHHQHRSRVLAEFRHTNPTAFFDLRASGHCQVEYNCHLVFCPHKRQPIVDAKMAQPLLKYLLRVAKVREFEILSLSLLDDHVHLFAALPPKLSPADFATIIMNNSSHWLWQHNPGAFKLWDTVTAWSSASFLGTAGKVTTRHAANFLRR